MPLYYFNIYNGNGLTEDEEGRELPDLEPARLEALQGIRSILAEDVLQGRLDLRGRIDVLDEHEETLFSVAFREALEIKDAVPAADNAG
ncbi:MAG TPA: hypothetical protein VEC11_14855 [Allosphingosinicella sp.]|nr:hypothetical protein [Allosphingosinicella sp.]